MRFPDHALIRELEGTGHRIASLPELRRYGVLLEQLPISVRLLLEGALRACATGLLEFEEVLSVGKWPMPDVSLPFRPGRVLMQDAAGLPLLVDMTALRDAVADRAGNPANVDFAVPAALVVDHSVRIDHWRTAKSLEHNLAEEMSRNQERYAFLRWAANAFRGLTLIPPGNGIVHQVHLERIARGVLARDGYLFPDTVVGTDSHTTMVNGIGVLGWGVGGIEAEEVLLGETLWLPAPEVVGVELIGELGPCTSATDLALHLTEFLRKRGVVGSFLEFYGPALSGLSVAERATVANMAPEYGATMALFPIDDAVCDYLERTGRPSSLTNCLRAYYKHQGMFGNIDRHAIAYSRRYTFNLSSIGRTVAGPKRPDQRISLKDINRSLNEFLHSGATRTSVADGEAIQDGDIAIASITSCTNTSNPRVLIEAGLLARNALARGLFVKPSIKTSLAPGSRHVPAMLKRVHLLPPLERLGFRCVAFGCATCVGNSGSIAPAMEAAASRNGVQLAAVLSGNRNFENRIHASITLNYLMSPPLVVAFAIAGSITKDLTQEPLGFDTAGRPVWLQDVWPQRSEIDDLLSLATQVPATESWVSPDEWTALNIADGERYPWSPESTFLVRPPFFDRPFEGFVDGLKGARPLLVLGDGVTTDHISPVGRIPRDSAAARYLLNQGVAPDDLDSYAARRGNHHVMKLGTFANPRLRNRLAGDEGPIQTVHRPSGKLMSISAAADRYQAEGVPLVIVAGRNYGMGSARDWAAKGTALLGVRAVVATSFERIHRSNLIRVGVAPIECQKASDIADLLCATPDALLDIIPYGAAPHAGLQVSVRTAPSDRRCFKATLRADTDHDRVLLSQGGIFAHAITP